MLFRIARSGSETVDGDNIVEMITKDLVVVKKNAYTSVSNRL